METFSLHILADQEGVQVWPRTEMKEMWVLLRAFILHHVRDTDPEEWEGRRVQVRDGMFKFSKLGLQVFGRKFCTYNLHLLNCRMYDQESAKGPTAYKCELWVERKIQEFKTTVRHHTTHQPELRALNDVLVRMALAHAKCEDDTLQGVWIYVIMPVLVTRVTLWFRLAKI